MRLLSKNGKLLMRDGNLVGVLRVFRIGTGFSNDVRTIIEDSNGKIYAGGDFTAYQDVSAESIIRLNPDGSRDPGFDMGTGFDSDVRTIIEDSGGKIYAGGFFTAYQGSTANRIIRLNPDGTRDTAFDLGTGFNSTVRTIIEDSGGKIYAGGQFESYQGVSANRIIRLNPDGTRDTAFDLGTGFNSTVLPIIEDSGGKVYVGGNFTSYQGVPANYIIRLNPDGSRDTGFDMGTGFSYGGLPVWVFSIIEDSGGKIYVGGGFSTYQDVSANRIIRLNPDGTRDTGFDMGTGLDGFWIYSIIEDSNGKIYAGGIFSTYQGVSANYIIRLNPDGTRDTAFDLGTGFNSTVRTIIEDSGGKIYAGGGFTSYQDVSANRIIRLNPNGTSNTIA